MFDEPVEEATEWLFYNAFKTIGGEQAVGARKHGHDHKEKLNALVEGKKEL
jgi:mitochondrial fission process protein 1